MSKAQRENLITNADVFGRFCRRMNSQLGCRHDGCESVCKAEALRYVQKQVNEGDTVEQAVDKWCELSIPHEKGEGIIADCLGLVDLRSVRYGLKEEK